MSPLMTINGERVSAQSTIGVVDPATGEVFATAPDASREQMNQAVAAAKAAGRAWARDEGRRVDALRAAADLLESKVQDIAPLLTSEQGKPLGAAAYEVTETARWVRAAADLEL